MTLLVRTSYRIRFTNPAIKNTTIFPASWALTKLDKTPPPPTPPFGYGIIQSKTFLLTSELTQHVEK